MKNKLFLIVLLAVLTACEKQEEPKEKAYYNMEDADWARIPNLPVGSSLIYKNEKGASIRFTISNYYLDQKKLYAEGMGFFEPYAKEYFYYDILDIEYTDDSSNTYSLKFTKWPKDEELAKTDLTKKFESVLYSQIYNFPYWNQKDGFNSPQFYIPLSDPSIQKVTIYFNGKWYNNVLKIISKDNEPFSEQRKVNVIYYTDGLGIIGFDDLDNNHWRLQ